MTLASFMAFVIVPAVRLAAQGAGTEYDGVVMREAQAAASDALPAILTVDDQAPPVGVVDPRLFGVAYDWSEMNTLLHERNLRVPFVETFSRLPLPLNRIGGAEGQAFRWKQAVGPASGRTPQKLWSWQKQPSIIHHGPLEWVRTIMDARPDSEFVIALNMLSDTPEDHADLARLLLGRPGEAGAGATDWPALRVAAGLPGPVAIFVWELGNENDWRGEKQAITPEDYIARCRASIAAIRAVDPRARFTAHAGAAPHNTTHPRPYEGGWQVWHREVLKALGDDIDYLVFHPYYNRAGVAEQEGFIAEIRRDIVAITGSDRIKLFFSEHAAWPPEIGKRENWFHTHSLHGSLLTAQFLVDQLQHPGTIAACWSMSAGPWGFFYPTSGSAPARPALYTTGLFDTFQLLNRAAGDLLLASRIEGPRTRPGDHGTTFASAAMRDSESGELRILLVNLEPVAARELELRLASPHRLVEWTSLSADALGSHNTEGSRAFRFTTANAAGTGPATHHTVPARSLVSLRLKPVR